jgi:hypothetical protein
MQALTHDRRLVKRNSPTDDPSSSSSNVVGESGEPSQEHPASSPSPVLVAKATWTPRPGDATKRRVWDERMQRMRDGTAGWRDRGALKRTRHSVKAHYADWTAAEQAAFDSGAMTYDEYRALSATHHARFLQQQQQQQRTNEEAEKGPHGPVRTTRAQRFAAGEATAADYAAKARDLAARRAAYAKLKEKVTGANANPTPEERERWRKLVDGRRTRQARRLERETPEQRAARQAYSRAASKQRQAQLRRQGMTEFTKATPERREARREYMRKWDTERKEERRQKRLAKKAARQAGKDASVDKGTREAGSSDGVESGIYDSGALPADAEKRTAGAQSPPPPQSANLGHGGDDIEPGDSSLPQTPVDDASSKASGTPSSPLDDTSMLMSLPFSPAIERIVSRSRSHIDSWRGLTSKVPHGFQLGMRWMKASPAAILFHATAATQRFPSSAEAAIQPLPATSLPPWVLHRPLRP